MKKFVLLLSLILCSCSFKSDFYTLSIDGYRFTVGYDDVDYIRTTFNLSVKDKLEVGETISNINVYSFDDYYFSVDVTNNTDEVINADEAIISKMVIYLNDLGPRAYAINDVELDDSVTSNCDKFKGTLIKRNGYACVLESSKSGQLNAIELYGDILASDQDKLDHIVMYIK